MSFEIKAKSPFWKEPKITKLTPASKPIKAGNDGNHDIRLVIVDNITIKRLIGNGSSGVDFPGTDLTNEYTKSLFEPLNRTFIEHILFVKKTLVYKAPTEENQKLE